MKTGDAADVSRAWQLSHLKHYFRSERAARSVGNGRLKLVGGSKGHSHQDFAQSRRKCLSALPSVGIERPRAANDYSAD